MSRITDVNLQEDRRADLLGHRAWARCCDCVATCLCRGGACTLRGRALPPGHRRARSVGRVDFTEYVDLLRHGAVVACPTETQLGLLADALDPEALARVSALKERPAGDPIGVLVPSLDSAIRLVRDVPASAVLLAQQHWPAS